MFYFLAKFLWFAFQPSSLLALALIIGTVLSRTIWRRLAHSLLAGALLVLIVISLSPIGEWLYLPLENRFPRAALTSGPPITGIIVLGGVEETRTTPPRELASLNDSAERLIEAVVLAQRFPQARVVFSGGSGSVFTTAEVPEAAIAGSVFEALGIAKERITLEGNSHDTYQNAVFTKRLVDPKPHERWALITSAWHMPRAIGCFRRAGFAVEAWPVDYRTTGSLDLLIEPSLAWGLHQIDFLAHEYVGLVAYYLRGRTDALLPGP